MSSSQTSYNLDFLNNYFTTKEFDFINDPNSETKKINEQISKEILTRDFIVDFINNLTNYSSTLSSNNTQIDIFPILSEVQDMFKKVNENISLLQEIRDTSSQISNNIIKLLVTVESSPNDTSSYINQIKDLKNVINSFSEVNTQTQDIISANNVKIKAFFEQDTIKLYLTKFKLTFNLEVLDKKDNSIFKTPSTIEFNFDPTRKPEENHVLLISEKKNKVFLPYSKKEVLLYLEQFPNSYKSPKDVIKKEFEVSLDYYMKHPVIARFRETYSLIRDREAKSVIDAFKYGIDLMFHYDLNPAIIAACKTQQQLENYITCMEKNKLDDFKDFEIKFEVLPRKR